MCVLDKRNTVILSDETKKSSNPLKIKNPNLDKIKVYRKLSIKVTNAMNQKPRMPLKACSS